jgi:hypothetical protein
MAARLQDPAHLAEERGQVPEVLHHQPADHPVERPRLEGEPFVEIMDDEADALRSRLPARLREHPLREVDRRHLGARGGQPERVSARPAPQVQHGQPGHIPDQLPHMRPFQGQQGVRVMVVDRRPPIIPLSGR